jgi:hypothetical protein
VHPNPTSQSTQTSHCAPGDGEVAHPFAERPGRKRCHGAAASSPDSTRDVGRRRGI